MRNANSKRTGSPIDRMGSHDGVVLVQIPTSETLRLKARRSHALWPAHFGKAQGTQDAGGSANRKHAAPLARSDLRNHLFDYGCYEFGLFDLRRRHSVIRNVTRDDSTNTNCTLAIGFAAGDACACRSQIDSERKQLPISHRPSPMQHRTCYCSDGQERRERYTVVGPRALEDQQRNNQKRAGDKRCA